MVNKQERRQHERFPVQGTIQIHTSISDLSYSAAIQDISRTGARIHTSRLPQAGEEITFHLLNESGIQQYKGLGQVVWVQGRGTEGERGFAISFDQELRLTKEDFLIHEETEEHLTESTRTSSSI